MQFITIVCHQFRLARTNLQFVFSRCIKVIFQNTSFFLLCSNYKVIRKACVGKSSSEADTTVMVFQSLSHGSP